MKYFRSLMGGSFMALFSGCGTQQTFSNCRWCLPCKMGQRWSQSKIECRSERLPGGKCVIRIVRGRDRKEVVINDMAAPAWGKEAFTSLGMDGSYSGIVFRGSTTYQGSVQRVVHEWRLTNDVVIFEEIIQNLSTEWGTHCELFWPFRVYLDASSLKAFVKAALGTPLSKRAASVLDPNR